jgi:DNA-binding NarL/FixJ family response regulator
MQTVTSTTVRPKLSNLMVTLLVGHANGKQVKEMAKERYVSYSSATQTIAEAKRRLEARSLAHAVIRAQGVGYLSFPTGPDLLVCSVS